MVKSRNVESSEELHVSTVGLCRGDPQVQVARTHLRVTYKSLWGLGHPVGEFRCSGYIPSPPLGSALPWGGFVLSHIGMAVEG